MSNVIDLFSKKPITETKEDKEFKERIRLIWESLDRIELSLKKLKGVHNEIIR